MKKVLFIMAAALMTLAQCRKQETMPATPSANTIKMTVTAGPGAKTNIDDNGAITWSEGDVLYVSDGTNWLGSLTLVSGEGNASGTFTGNISEISEGTTCHFFYLGHDNGMAEPSGENAASISFASQDGSRDGALKYHMGHGSANVTVSGGEATGAVAMRTEIAIAHLKLTMNSDPYPGSVTMGGTGISNTLSVSPDGSFSGSGTDGITIGGTSGDRYVTLIPTGTSSVDVSFSGSATGSMTFGHGIQANNLYGMANGIEVTLAAAPSYLPGEFTINTGGTKVKFSKGNLYYDGTTDNKWKFEANQYDFRTYNGKGSCINGTYNKDGGTPANDWGLFGWSGSNTSYYGKSTTENNDDYSGSFMDWGGITDLPLAGDNKTWRTLSKDEWLYLISTRTVNDGNGEGKSYKRATVNGVYGLILYPDSYTAQSTSTSYSGDTWTSMEEAGVVFLPAAGGRNGTNVSNVGSIGYYWSSTLCTGSSQSYFLSFKANNVNPQGGSNRYFGSSVRLVR